MLISLILLLGRICAQPLFHNDSVRCYEEIDGRFDHFYTGFFEYRPDGKILVDSTLFYEDGAPIDFITELFEYDVRACLTYLTANHKRGDGLQILKYTMNG